MNEPRKVRWIIAHFPVKLFIRAAHQFRKELNKLVPGQFDIEIITGMGSYLRKYGHELDADTRQALSKTSVNIPGLEEVAGSIKDYSRSEMSDEEVQHIVGSKSVKTFNELKDYWKTVFNALKDGHFEMSQTQINLIGSHLDENMHAIDLPYLFNGHDHVAEALDGEIGIELARRVKENTNVVALGYTYSGGYRIIGSTEGITCLDDLSSQKFISFTAPSTRFFEGANVDALARFHTTADDIGDVAENGGAIETTYIRFNGKNVLKTNHSMFMTSILTSESFMDSLTEEQREAFVEAARRVAKAERAWSVEDAEEYERKAEERGIKIVDISAEDEARLRQASLSVYEPEVLESMGIDPKIVAKIIEIGRKYKN